MPEISRPLSSRRALRPRFGLRARRQPSSPSACWVTANPPQSQGGSRACLAAARQRSQSHPQAPFITARSNGLLGHGNSTAIPGWQSRLPCRSKAAEPKPPPGALQQVVVPQPNAKRPTAPKPKARTSSSCSLCIASPGCSQGVVLAGIAASCSVHASAPTSSPRAGLGRATADPGSSCPGHCSSRTPCRSRPRPGTPSDARSAREDKRRPPCHRLQARMVGSAASRADPGRPADMRNIARRTTSTFHSPAFSCSKRALMYSMLSSVSFASPPSEACLRPSLACLLLQASSLKHAAER